MALSQMLYFFPSAHTQIQSFYILGILLMLDNGVRTIDVLIDITKYSLLNMQNIQKKNLDEKLNPPSHVVPKIDNSKSPNDFGFHKKSFSIVFTENEIKKTSGINLEKQLLSIRDEKISIMEEECIISVNLMELNNRSSSLIKKTLEETNDFETNNKNTNNILLKKQELTLVDSFDEESIIDKQSKEKDKFKFENKAGKSSLSSVVGTGAFVPDNSYALHSSVYSQFMADYLSVAPLYKEVYKENYSYSVKSPQKNSFKPGDEVIGYKERMQHVKAVMANALMNAPMNHVDPDSAERYKYWVMASKFNQMLSFIYYDSALRS